MSANTVDRLHVAVLDGHLMDDATLARLVPECRSLTAFTTGADQAGLEQRWAAIAPGTELIDGGQVADLREAMVECAKRRIVVISTGVPADPASFVAHALQGAAAMTEFDVPGVAVHVMRPVVRQGSVAWLTDTGELSGYGVLFAVGYAHLHSTSVDLIEPSSGLGRPRTAEALDDALAFAEAAGVPVIRHTDPSPFARVLRDEHCMVVHPVLDAPKGFNLLHPGELSRKAVASGNPAVVVELLEKFPGDVVAVFDGVHLLQGSIPAARIAAGVALGVVAAAGVGTMVAAPASATTISQQAQSGVTVTATGHNGMAHLGSFHVVNSLDHAVTMTLTATWVSSGNHPPHHSIVSNVVVQAGQSLDVNIPRPDGIGKGSYHIGSVEGVVTHHQDAVVTTTPEKAPDPVVVTGTVQTFTELSPVIPVVAVPGTTDHELETSASVPQLVPPDPVVQQVPKPMEIPPPQPIAVPPQPIAVPPLPQQGPQDVPQATPTRVPPEVPQAIPHVVPQQVPHAIPQVVPQPQAPDLIAPPLQPTLVPPVQQQVPPLQQPQPQAPDLVAPPLQPTLVPPVQQQVPPLQQPQPMVQPQVQPMLVPPLQATPNEVVTESVPTVVAGGVVTPDVPVDVGSSVVTSAVTTEGPTTEVAPTVGGTTIPGDVSTPTMTTTTTTQHAGTPHHATHHASHPGHVTSTAVDGDHAPAGELAHTGGNTAILAIVAGSLIAAGAGLAVAGRMGKDDPDTGATEG